MLRTDWYSFNEGVGVLYGWVVEVEHLVEWGDEKLKEYVRREEDHEYNVIGGIGALGVLVYCFWHLGDIGGVQVV